jgi:hypothetical protein
MYLVALDLFGNPLANEPNYRLLCIWTFPSLHVLDRHEVTDEERLAAIKKFGKVSQDLVAFGKRTTKWHNPPPIALASLSATASDMYKELERVRARVEAEEAGKAAGDAAKAEAAEEAGQGLVSKHVRNDYIRVMAWSNPAIEFAAGSSSLQPLQARASATVTSDASMPAQASSLTITLDQAKYAQCVACAPLVAAHVLGHSLSPSSSSSPPPLPPPAPPPPAPPHPPPPPLPLSRSSALLLSLSGRTVTRCQVRTAQGCRQRHHPRSRQAAYVIYSPKLASRIESSSQGSCIDAGHFCIVLSISVVMMMMMMTTTMMAMMLFMMMMTKMKQWMQCCVCNQVLYA